MASNCSSALQSHSVTASPCSHVIPVQHCCRCEILLYLEVGDGKLDFGGARVLLAGPGPTAFRVQPLRMPPFYRLRRWA